MILLILKMFYSVEKSLERNLWHSYENGGNALVKKKRNLMNAVIIGVFLIDETSDVKAINYVANNKEGRIFTF